MIIYSYKTLKGNYHWLLIGVNQMHVRQQFIFCVLLLRNWNGFPKHNFITTNGIVFLRINQFGNFTKEDSYENNNYTLENICDLKIIHIMVRVIQYAVTDSMIHNGNKENRY